MSISQQIQNSIQIPANLVPYLDQASSNAFRANNLRANSHIQYITSSGLFTYLWCFSSSFRNKVLTIYTNAQVDSPDFNETYALQSI